MGGAVRSWFRNLIRSWVAGPELSELARWRIAHAHVHGGLSEFPQSAAALQFLDDLVAGRSRYGDLNALRAQLRELQPVTPIAPAGYRPPEPPRRRREDYLDGDSIPYQYLVGACGDER
jgi:hypothetical protein